MAVDSPAGHIATTIDELAAHLPSAGEQFVCPICSAQSWPCTAFDDAAHRVIAAGVRLADLVPRELHPLLWPPATALAPQPARWFNEETANG